MIKIILGIFIGIFLFPLLCDFADLNYELNPKSKIAEKIWSKSVLPGYKVHYAFLGKCTKDVSRNGHGWIFIKRNYYDCNKLSIFISDLIYGEYTKPRNPELEKQICKDCKL